MKHTLRGLLLASAFGACLCVLPGVLPGVLPARAAELGQVHFTFEGAEQAWFTAVRDIKGEARPSATLSGKTPKVKLEAFRDPAAPSLESLTITWLYPRSVTNPGPPDYTQPVSVAITWVLEGFTGPRWKARDVQLNLAVADLAGDEGYLAGFFSAEFCYAEGIYDALDEESCRPVSGTLDTRIVRKD